MYAQWPKINYQKTNIQ